ncbi:MAG: methyl-accepting chemotaxis protein, partial [Spirochaetaceae bacterium]|nr:methyl-accepting chemotaxis protein [Spirochaetaceae bacterium]
MKLKFRLSLIVIAILAVVISIVSVVLLSRARGMQTTTAQSEITNLTGVASKNLEVYFEGYLYTINTLAFIMADYDDVEPDRRRARYDANMLAVIESNPNLVSIYTLWNPGFIDGSMEPYDSWFSKRDSATIQTLRLRDTEDLSNLYATMSTKIMISDVERGKFMGKDIWQMRVTVPIINNKTNQQVGFVGIIVDLSYAEELISNATTLKTAGYTNGREILYTKNGTIAAHYDISMVGKNIRDPESLRILGQEAVDNTLETLRTGVPDTGQNAGRFFASYPFTVGSSEDTLTVLSSVPSEDVFHYIKEMTQFTVLIAAIMIIVSAIVIWFVSSNIAKRIVLVGARMKDIAQGEGDLTSRITMNDNDEIGEMSNYFNQTM